MHCFTLRFEIGVVRKLSGERVCSAVICLSGVHLNVDAFVIIFGFWTDIIVVIFALVIDLVLLVEAVELCLAETCGKFASYCATTLFF